MKIKIVVVGKIKEKIYQQRILEYVKWVNQDIRTDIITLKEVNGKKLDLKLKPYLQSDNYRICVCENGIQYSSKQFSEFIFEKNQDLVFFIGGPDGHPEIIRKESNSILSLSNMTLPHEMALLVLTEQIFRAISIKKGAKYHR
tara:strand:+ start:386 stop:814 length:429 start_codon:yes stop_codon:yes gene_type:complete